MAAHDEELGGDRGGAFGQVLAGGTVGAGGHQHPLGVAWPRRQLSKGGRSLDAGGDRAFGWYGAPGHEGGEVDAHRGGDGEESG